MELLTVFELLNYGLVLLFGLFLSVRVAGGYGHGRRPWLPYLLGLLFLLVQGLCYSLWGVVMAERFYPLIVHLPLTLVLTFVLKKPFGVSLVSVCTAYLCCQLPHWVRLTMLMLTDSPLISEITYTLCIIPAFWLLRRYFAPAAYSAMTYSRKTLLLFGSLPLAYYLFDYATTVYYDIFATQVQAIYEFLPTALIVFYVLFLALYHVQSQKEAQAELQRAMLETALKQSHGEMERLKATAHQTAVYHHDMRHHLNMIDGFLHTDKPEQASEYIRRIREDLSTISVHRYCENEAVNLLCSSFAEKAERMGVTLTMEVSLPKALPISDTELCSVVSNGLENALHAVEALDKNRRWVQFSCRIRNNNLLLEIKNPYKGKIRMQDGVPVSVQENHGYGCHSIQTIARQNRGHCLFSPENGVFTLRVALPLIEK
ncbi:MAG: GHKL domain-containing protein [Oscillospiraceae bacterium]|nr:GHKL domain-containing protein [Oscillospiraceae bacterium]